MTATELTPVDQARKFDYWSADLAADPYPVLAGFRAECPVARSDELDGYYVLSRYDDVNGALRDHTRFTSTIMTAPAANVAAATTNTGR